MSVIGAILFVAQSAAMPGVIAQHQTRPPQQESGRLRLLDSLRFEGGSEIAADDEFVYANQLDGTTARGQYPDRGGMRVLTRRGGSLVERGYLHCPGNDNDLQPLGRRLVVVAHHTSRCNAGHGIFIVDTAEPASPRVIGRVALPDGSAHTVTPHPQAPYVYVSPGGLFNGGGEETIVDVSNPRRPKIAGTFLPGSAGCHDLTTMERDGRVFGFCSGLGETSIWDLSTPLRPEEISRIQNPAIEFMYVALPSPEGNVLAVVDEAFAGHECTAGQGPGGVWLYDISDLARPVPIGRIPPPQRGAAPAATTDITTWCAAHGIDWHPREPLLAVTWYSAGLSVFDVTTPLTPVEIGFFQAADSLAEAVVWHRGLLYANDLRRGVDVFTLRH